ncbi:MAG TPA: EAL domain-containing protein [Gammaproteobacteria bacterium]|nr:EAL domain-containing protein [Gammaproteobacteria bacterium]
MHEDNTRDGPATDQPEIEDDRSVTRSLLGALPGTFCMFDETGRLLRWNRELERSSGYSASEIVVMRAWDFVAAGERDTFRRGITTGFKRGKFNMEVTLLSRQGEGLPCLFSARRARIGGRYCLVGIGVDISVRRTVQEALRESEERLRLVSSVTTDVIWDWNLKTDATWHNNGLERVFGYTRADTVRDWFAHLHPDDRDRVRNSVSAHVRSGQGLWESRYRMLRADGSYAEVYDRGLMVHDADGRPARMVGAMVDVTAQVRAEAQLALAARTLECIPQGVVTLDTELRVLSVNPGYTEITGERQAEIAGSPWSCLHAGPVNSALRSEILAKIERDQRWQGELEVRRANGDYEPALLSLDALRDANGRLCNYIAVLSDQSRLRQYQQQVVFLERHNALTGLPAKQAMDEYLSAVLQSGTGVEGALAVLAIDLDGFKIINDSFGDSVGDDLLQQFAQSLVRHASPASSVYHLGSDSFCLILRQEHAEQTAPVLAQQLLRMLEQPFSSRDNELYLSACIGIAVYPAHGADAAGLVKNANIALARAKQRAPNACEIYLPEMNRASADMLLLGTKLRRAIKQGELLLDYQPYVDLGTGQILGVEALARWRHPELGLIPPTRFIPVAEETGLIVPLGQWVLQAACRQMAAWRQAGHTRVHLAVNISVRQLHQADFVDQVAAAVIENGLSPHTLVLEITESVMMGDPERIREILKQLHELGVDIAVDDFGTGYSSLSYINHFRVDYLKIDRSFVNELSVNHDQASITRAIIAMARHLDITVIAEGVETRTQHQLLRELGCDQGQGFLYARPQSPEAVLHMLGHPAPL